MARTVNRHRAFVHAHRDRYDELLELQSGACGVPGCRAVPRTRRFHIDHDHRTMELRGLLCHVHNRRLWPGVTPDELRAMADYLDAPPAARLL